MHAIFIVDPLTAIQAGTIWRGKVHVHFWWIVHVFAYSIWIESLFEGQWFSSVGAFLFGGEEYLQSSLHIFQALVGWLGWMTLNPGGDESLWGSPLSFLRLIATISHLTFHLKYPLFPHPNLFRSLIFLTRSDCDTLASFIPLLWRVTVLAIVTHFAHMR